MQTLRCCYTDSRMPLVLTTGHAFQVHVYTGCTAVRNADTHTCTGYVVAAERELAQAVCSAFSSVACGAIASALTKGTMRRERRGKDQ